MKLYEGMDVKFNIFLNWALGGGKCLSSRSGRFIALESY